MNFNFPPIFLTRLLINGNAVNHLSVPAERASITARPFSEMGAKGFLLEDDRQRTTLVLTNRCDPPQGFERVLRMRSPKGLEGKEALLSPLSVKTWVLPKCTTDLHDCQIKWEETCSGVCDTWLNGFSAREEIRDGSSHVIQRGLRHPQIGAVYATMGYWTASNSPVTVVMPTGTGKTETMLALLISKRCRKLLVIVPTDPLRDQTAEKFITLGVLKDFQVVSQTCGYPSVGVLRHRPKSEEEAEAFFSMCNVVVTTMSIASGCDDAVQKRMAHLCSHLFIDEAHHIAAPTWDRFKDNFQERPVLQFTATPFRNDGKTVDGHVVYNYPLRKAQEEGYFKQIRFSPIIEFDEDRADALIADKAVAQLRADLERGFDHILMARVRDIGRTKDIYPLYAKHADLNPVVIHSNLPTKDRKAILGDIKAKRSRIIVCVDMLGEGFDLPELKIAALHDIHKSLGVTLQFTGRFTRAKDKIGDATFVANIADPRVQESLESLYAEDSDWNQLLRDMSSDKIREQIQIADFNDKFQSDDDVKLPLKKLWPAMSTVIYRMKDTSWKPKNFINALDKSVEILPPEINHRDGVLLFITKRREPVRWADSKELLNTRWDLYVVYWDKTQKLLFINSSNTESLHQRLAREIGGQVTLINGEEVYRAAYGINRLTLQNVGLKRALFGPVSFTMHTGFDVNEGLTSAHRRNTFKSNFFGVGYENGTRTSIGCSSKGRIWSMRVATVKELCDWCWYVGSKILDEKIDVKRILEGILMPHRISTRPSIMPIAIQWPDTFLNEPESSVYICFDGGFSCPLYETSITLVDPAETGPLKFTVSTEEHSAEYELEIRDSPDGEGFRYKVNGLTDVGFRIGSTSRTLADWFTEDPPKIWLADGSYIENNFLFKIDNQAVSRYEKGVIEVWDWAGVNLRKESQKQIKRVDSIQYHVIQRLKQSNYEVIFDDDDKGEAADIITFKVADQQVYVELYHCKFSGAEKSGRRVDDLYVVCGQAKTSIHWKEDISKLISHMQRREAKRINANKHTRFEVGDQKTLRKIERMARVYRTHFKIFVVQPGLSKSKVSDQQLEQLGSTELYLQETFSIPLGVIASA